MKKQSEVKIEAFGKKINRDKAYRIIFNDFLTNIVFARNTDSLFDLLINGWVSLEKWSNKELEDYIEGLCVDNQAGEKI